MNAIATADDYCERIRNRELIVLPKAETVFLTLAEGKGSLGRLMKEEHSLAFLLAKRMTDYQSIRDYAVPSELPEELLPRLNMIRNSTLEDRALELLEVIDQANSHNAFSEVSLSKRFVKCQHENEQLKKQKDQLEKENLKLKSANENLHKLVKNLGGSSTSTLEEGDKDE